MVVIILIVAVAAHEVRSQIRHAESMAHFHALSHFVDVGYHTFESRRSSDFELPSDSRLVRVKRATLASQLTNAHQMRSVLGFVPTPLQQRELEQVAVGLADHAVLLTTDGFGIVELILIAE